MLANTEGEEKEIMNSIAKRRVIHQVKIDPKISAPKIAASTSNTLGIPKTVFQALKKDSVSSVIKTFGEIQVCSLMAANASVDAVESCRLLKMNAAGE
ncbi:hypothetical protein TNCT_149371 [Trichonephila clavata]|uniref:Uncharacterized protein n=1 Tax=Trichonephila clavata TaxID=2740835 RepID=A0A8X6L071_TRICU|nr:hypothetical protein TNCT_149371 [Trichonephila clavata]